MVSKADVVRFRLANEQLERRLRRDVRVLWRRVSGSPAPVIRDAFVEVLPSLVSKYGEAAAVVAAEYFEGITQAAAVLAEAVPEEAVRASARWAAGGLFEGRPDAALNGFMSSSARHMLQHGRSTVAESTARHPRLLYARVPNSGACSWCLMLASRGAVYGSRRDAGAKDEGNEYHDDCYCSPTAFPADVGDEDLPYDRQSLYDLYEKAREEAPGHDQKSIAGAIREMYGLK